MLIILKDKFKADEIAMLRVKEKDVKFCDQNNFSKIGFEGNTVRAVGNSKGTTYMVKMALEAGATTEQARTQVATHQ